MAERPILKYGGGVESRIQRGEEAKRRVLSGDYAKPAARPTLTYIPDPEQPEQSTLPPISTSSVMDMPKTFMPPTPDSRMMAKPTPISTVPDISNFAVNNRNLPSPAPQSKGVASAMAGDLGELLDRLTFGATKPLTSRFENYITNENEATRVAPGQLDPHKQEIGKEIAGTIGDIGAGVGAYRAAARMLAPVARQLPGAIERGISPIASRLAPETGAALRLGAQQAGKVLGTAATGAAAGALFQAPKEATEALYGENNQTLGQRLGDIGESAALGGALEVGGRAIGQLAKSIADRTGLTDKLTAFVNRSRAVNPELETATREVFSATPERKIGIATGPLRNASQEQYINKVMSEIKPIVTERMTPPLENPNELAKWLQPHLDTSLNQIRKLSYDDMVELANEVKSHMSMYDVTLNLVPMTTWSNLRTRLRVT